jgi:hypothetical protein
MISEFGELNFDGHRKETNMGILRLPHRYALPHLPTLAPSFAGKKKTSKYKGVRVS